MRNWTALGKHWNLEILYFSFKNLVEFTWKTLYKNVVNMSGNIQVKK